MPKEINNNEYWEKKDARSTRTSASMNGNNNAVNANHDLILLGIIKYEDGELIIDKEAKKIYMDEIRYDQQVFKSQSLEDYHPIKQDYAKGEAEAFAEKNYGHDGSATEKQCKAVWAIIYGRNGKLELEKELTVDKEHLNNLSFEEASDFIDKYGKFNK